MGLEIIYYLDFDFGLWSESEECGRESCDG
jgi:hypothetical protein